MCCDNTQHKWQVFAEVVTASRKCKAYGLFTSFLGEPFERQYPTGFYAFDIDRSKLLPLTAAMKMVGVWDIPWVNDLEELVDELRDNHKVRR